MVKNKTIVALLFFAYCSFAQNKIDFENFNLSKGEFLNGMDGSGGFTSGDAFLYNSYNSEFMYWGGWAISAANDTVTGNFTNEFSAASGGGAESSLTYAVSYGTENTLVLKGSASGKPLNSISINNGTYTALSMKNGDAFAKKFGGLSGNDKDFLLLTIRAWYQGKISKDSINFYLADYRFEDNKKDYIIKRWTPVDLTALGNVDSLQFVMTSSDVGSFGINTPTYFCIDNVLTSAPLGIAVEEMAKLTVFPNPANDHIQVNIGKKINGFYAILDINGRAVLKGICADGAIDVSMLHSGLHVVEIAASGKVYRRIFIKQ